MYEDQQTVEKITRRYTDLRPPRDKVTQIRDIYARRRDAIQKFTDRIEKTGGFVDDAELETLREAGVGEDEIKALVKRYAA